MTTNLSEQLDEGTQYDLVCYPRDKFSDVSLGTTPHEMDLEDLERYVKGSYLGALRSDGFGITDASATIFSEYVMVRVQSLLKQHDSALKAEYEEKVREARIEGYIDGIKSDERSTDEVITKSTIKALEDVRMYALDCTFGTNWGSKHVDKAIPIKSIESRIEYFKSTLTPPPKEGIQ